MKCYAVANGREIGVFYDWSEVEPLIKGFKGARQQKFDDEVQAHAFIEEYKMEQKKLKNLREKQEENKRKALLGEHTPENMLFTDGGYSVNHEIFGGGAFILLSDGQTINLGIASPDATVDDSSPQHIYGELKSVMLGVKMMNEIFNRKEFIIVYDFEGIKQFLSFNGKPSVWEPDATHSIQYKKFMEKYIEKHKLNISFRKEKSHTNVLGNEMADQLASESLVYHKKVQDQLYVL